MSEFPSMEQPPPTFMRRAWAGMRRYWSRFWESGLWGALQRIESVAFIILLAVLIWRVATD